MRHPPHFTTRALASSALLLWLTAHSASPAEPAMRLVSSSSPGQNLVRNGDFEQRSAWNAQPGGFAIVPGAGRRGSQALVCDAQAGRGSFGAGQTITFASTNLEPLVIHGWSKAQNVDGSADNGYSLYVDIVFTDGTPLWGQTANFHTGTHDWEERQFVLVPEKPIKQFSIYCLFRGHTGKVWFDDVTVVPLKTGNGAVMFEGSAMALNPHPSTAAGPPRLFKTKDDFQLQLSGDSITSVRVAGQELVGNSPSGFLARDVAANSDVFGFENGDCPQLKLKLTTDFSARDDHILVTGRITDTGSRDRAVTLLFALPFDATGWQWGDDIRRSRTIAGNREFSNTVRIGCGATGTMSLYPLAAVYNEKLGLAIALDMGHPAVSRLVYHAGTKQLYVAYDFGLAPDTTRFPGSANFRFVVFRFDQRWGFRSAFQRFTEIFPDYFRVRSTEQGIWMPFTDISTVQGWEDFGFKYHEGNNNVPWDAAHRMLSFRYTEPMTWWMRMPKETPRTLPEALRIRDQLAAQGKGSDRNMAQVSKLAAMYDDSGQPSLQFRNEPWCNGAVWSLNPNPNLNLSPSPPNPNRNPNPNPPLNFATLHWNDAIKQNLYTSAAKAPQAGEYLDSLEGYTTADLNFRREHFHDTTVPLVFDTDTKRPALYKGLAVYEFTRWFCDDVHRLGKLTFANGVPYRFTFLCPWLDVLGTETDWLSGGKYHPVPDSQMALWRTMAAAKPYLLLMNTDFDAFTADLVERYFQRSLFYGMYPSMFSHNAADNPYWQNPKWYNRDRPLFKKYVPLIKRLAEAGWQPITAARCDNPNIWTERFGSGTNGVIYLTLFNNSTNTQSGRLSLDPDVLHLGGKIQIENLLIKASVQSEEFSITLGPQQATALTLHSRPSQ